MKMKLTFVIISGLCYVVFIYQFAWVTRDYLLYKTSTKVEYQMDESIELPAFSVAFETPIPMAELWQKAFPNQSYPYETFSSEGPEFENSTLGQHCFDVYDKTEKDAWDIKNWTRVDDAAVWDCFFHYFGNPPIRNYLQELHRYYGKHFWCRQPVGDNRAAQCQNTSICDQISYSVGYWGAISATLFSKFAPDCINLSPGGILTVYYNYSKIMPFKAWYNYVSMHPADAVMDYSRSQHLDLRSDQTIRYHRVVFKRLPAPYDTACHDYKMAPLNGSHSRSDCLAACQFDSVVEETVNGTSFGLSFYSVSRFFTKAARFPERARMSNIMKDKLGSRFLDRKWSQEMQKSCVRVCPVSCRDMKYEWALVATQREKKGAVMMVLKHQFDSDQSYSHFPAMDWFGYLGSIGGLAGMWTGFSFVSFWRRFYCLGFRFSEKVKNSRGKKGSAAAKAREAF